MRHGQPAGLSDLVMSGAVQLYMHAIRPESLGIAWHRLPRVSARLRTACSLPDEESGELRDLSARDSARQIQTCRAGSEARCFQGRGTGMPLHVYVHSTLTHCTLLALGVAADVGRGDTSIEIPAGPRPTAQRPWRNERPKPKDDNMSDTSPLERSQNARYPIAKKHASVPSRSDPAPRTLLPVFFSESFRGHCLLRWRYYAHDTNSI